LNEPIINANPQSHEIEIEFIFIHP